MSKPFEIGLVMAGAVSAGAYTAGVIDFLIQALDQWQKAKEAGNPDAPPHEARLTVLAGTSAGGMTAGIAAAALASEFPPVTDAGAASQANKLYDSWVKRIDIAQLLGKADLGNPEAPVRSLLDATVLDVIARDALSFAGAGRRRAYVAEQLHLVTTTSNLRGVPYNISFRADEVRAGHEMYAHADWVHFVLGEGACECPPGALPLDWGKRIHVDNWRLLEIAALATGAFPVGLAPRLLKYRRGLYDGRRWTVPAQGVQAEGGGCRYLHQQRSILPHWPESMPQDYECLCVDGGVMNNEPFDIARRLMLQDECANPRSAEEANRALVMVDPFPGAEADVANYEIKDDVVSVLMSMFAAMKNQARFKPEDLALAQAPDVYSRFLIAPSRDNALHPIACGALGGFSGFLSESFRVHDFMLGRKNCQSFLKNHFRLARDNPLFADWSAPLCEAQQTVEDGKAFLPVIPLLGSATGEPQVPPWPKYTTEDLNRLAKRIEGRYDAVMDRFAWQLARNNFLARKALQFFAWRKRGDFVKFVTERIAAELKAFELMR